MLAPLCWLYQCREQCHKSGAYVKQNRYRIGYDGIMWRSEGGEVVVRGACAELFAHGLLSLAETIRDSPQWVETGVGVFDRLSVGQQASVLDLIGPAALLRGRPCPPLRAATEGGFVSVFMHAAIGIEEGPSESEFAADLRRLVINSLEERSICFDQAVEGQDARSWYAAVRELAESYLWDSDYAMGDALADLPPDGAAAARERMTIDDDYFAWIPQDYGSERIESSMKGLVTLCLDYPEG